MSSREIVGRWVVSGKKGLADAKPYGGGSVVFKADGAFLASHIIVHDPDHGLQNFTGSGTWRVGDIDSRQIVLLVFKEMEGRRSVGGYGFPLEIAGNPGHRTLYIFRGDPDRWDTLDLRPERSVVENPTPSPPPS